MKRKIIPSLLAINSSHPIAISLLYREHRLAIARR